MSTGGRLNRKTRSENFSYEETKSLITIWKRKVIELRSHKRNHHVFKLIADEMRKLGYYRDSQTIHFKINNLTQQYRRLKRKIQTGNISYTDATLLWPFYYPIEEIFRLHSHHPIHGHEVVLPNETLISNEQSDHHINRISTVTHHESISLFANRIFDGNSVPTSNSQTDIVNGEEDESTMIETDRPVHNPLTENGLQALSKRKSNAEIEHTLENLTKTQQETKISIFRAFENQMTLLNKQISLQQASIELQNKILTTLEKKF